MDPDDQVEQVRRLPWLGGFLARSGVGVVLLAVAGTAFWALLALVSARWAPLVSFDVADTAVRRDAGAPDHAHAAADRVSTGGRSR